MKVLYAIQGTGNGHVSRAREIIPFLKEKCELDLLISGNQCDISLTHLVKYRLKGMSFIFGKKGGVDLLATYKNIDFFQFLKDFWTVPVHEYDLIINDFEPVTAWACKLIKGNTLSLSHQGSLLFNEISKPKSKNSIAIAILKYYAPVKIRVGFHFEKYNDQIFTPIIRREIRKANQSTENHYTVYLPAYNDEKIIKILSQIPSTNWQVFSKHSKKIISN